MTSRSWSAEAPPAWLTGAVAGLGAAVVVGAIGWRRSARRLAIDRIVLRAASELVAADTLEAVATAGESGRRLLRRVGRVATTSDLSTMDKLVEAARARVASAARVGSAERALDTLVEQASDVILVIDASDRIHYASPSARTLFGTARLHDVAVPDLIHPRDRRLAQYLLWHARRGDSAAAQSGRADLTTQGVDGRTAQVEATCRDLRSDDAVGGIVVTLRDVTGQRRLERELTEQASRDELTGLPNRLSFEDGIDRSLAAAAGVTGVLLLDLDHFRAVNESLGRPAGDDVLIEIGRRLLVAAGPGNPVARLGSDEFAILVPGTSSGAEVTAVAGQLLDALRRPLSIDGHVVSCGASIGVATAPEASTEEELLRHADLALHAAKAAGRDRWRLYSSSMVDAVRIRHEMRSHLVQALDEGTLVVGYQPIVELASLRPTGFEALVRCPHPTRGMLSPAEFIDVAEESGLIVPIGAQVLADATRTALSWSGAAGGNPPPYVSVNVSVRQFRSSGFVDSVTAALVQAALPPAQLVLEITESLLLHDEDAVWEDLKRLRDLGIRIAIDDFGTGYSALSYLRQVPLDIVKLDRMFVSTMATSRRQRELVRGIVGLIDTLRLDVVAEGIETADQRRICADAGCRYGQGYLFARPMPAADTLEWIQPALPNRAQSRSQPHTGHAPHRR